MDYLSNPEESLDKNYSEERQKIRKAIRAEDKKTKNKLLMRRARERTLSGDRRGACEDYQLAKNNGYVPPKEYKLFYKVITDPYCFFRTL